MEKVPFSSGWARPISSLIRPDARTRSISTSTLGYAVLSDTSPIAWVKRSIVAEMPHTMGIGGFEPGWP